MRSKTHEPPPGWRLASAHRVSAMVCLACSLLLVSCVGHRMYRPGDDSIVFGDGHCLAFVELDDQGELWSPSQVTRAVEHIQEFGATEQ